MESCLFCGLPAPDKFYLDEDEDKGSWSLACLATTSALFRIDPGDPLQEGMRGCFTCPSCRQVLRDIDLSLRLLDKLLSQVEQYQEQLLERVEINWERIRKNKGDLELETGQDLVGCVAKKFRQETAVVNAGMERFKVLLNLGSLREKKPVRSNIPRQEDSQDQEQDGLKIRQPNEEDPFQVKVEVESGDSDEDEEDPFPNQDWDMEYESQNMKNIKDDEDDSDSESLDDIKPITRNIPCPLCDLKCASERGLAIHTRKIHKKRDPDWNVKGDQHAIPIKAENDDTCLEIEEDGDDDSDSAEEDSDDYYPKPSTQKEKISRKQDIPCPLCDVKCVSVRGLAMHTRRIHKKETLPISEDPDEPKNTEGDDKCLEECEGDSDEEEDSDYSEDSYESDSDTYSPTGPSPKKKKKETMETSSKRTIPCPLCDMKYSSTSALANHNRKVHEKAGHLCNLCSLRFPTDDELLAHEEEHRSKEAPFTCTICGTVTPNSARLRRHVSITHTREPNHLCDICGLALLSLPALKTHRKMHAEYNEFTCTVCGHIAPSKASLVNHSYKHDATKSSICDICGKGFTYPASLKRHRVVHDEEYAHKCKICGKAFSHQQFLLKHEVIHSGLLPYSCRYCDKKFKACSNKWQHETLHCRNRPNKERKYHKPIHPKKKTEEARTVEEVEPMPMPPVSHCQGFNMYQNIY